MSGSSVDMTLVTLPTERFTRLLELTTRPLGKHASGGFQNRLKTWSGRLDEGARTVLLSHAAHGRSLDDMTWIAHAIRDKRIGGWQRHVSVIFEGTHPRFTNLAVKPPRPRSR